MFYSRLHFSSKIFITNNLTKNWYYVWVCVIFTSVTNDESMFSNCLYTSCYKEVFIFCSYIFSMLAFFQQQQYMFVTYTVVFNLLRVFKLKMLMFWQIYSGGVLDMYGSPNGKCLNNMKNLQSIVNSIHDLSFSVQVMHDTAIWSSNPRTPHTYIDQPIR